MGNNMVSLFSENVKTEVTNVQPVNIRPGLYRHDVAFYEYQTGLWSWRHEWLRGTSAPRSYNTWVSRVNPEALVPKAAQKDEAVVGCDGEVLRADLNALIEQVWDLTTMTAHVIGCRGKVQWADYTLEIFRCTRTKINLWSNIQLTVYIYQLKELTLQCFAIEVSANRAKKICERIHKTFWMSS